LEYFVSFVLGGPLWLMALAFLSFCIIKRVLTDLVKTR